MLLAVWNPVMKPIDLVLSLLLVGALAGLMLWRRHESQQPGQAADSETPPKAPAAKVISLHGTARPRRRPF